jgi:hypothetical protein
MSYPSPTGPPPKTQVTVEAARLWGGGVATGCVAALVAVVGVLISRDIFDVDLVRPALLLEVADAFVSDYALTAFLLALVATGVLHVLALITPRPGPFFGWIVGLATVCGVVTPFAIGSEQESQIATAAINLALGVCIGSLLGAVMSRTIFITTAPPPPGPPQWGGG